MEPRIQYAKTSDGVNIAYWKVGEGMPLVWVPEPPISHLQLEWSWNTSVRSDVARRGKWSVAAFDPRGLGLSDRTVHDLSLDARLLDLEAVVASLRLDRFVLAGTTFGAPIAAAYAAARPERVSRLVLLNAFTRPGDMNAMPRGHVLVDALQNDWELFTETIGALAFGWGKRGARRFAEFMRACATHETARQWYTAMQSDDVMELLSRVQAPTLLIHLSGLSYIEVDMARSLAARISNASLVVLEGTYQGNIDAVLNAIDDFVGSDEEAVPAAEPPEAGTFRTILFTDMQSSTALAQRVGDTAAQEVRRVHNTIVGDALRANGGSEIKHTGDGIMASFASASRALGCAIAIQRGVSDHVEEHADSPLAIYVGLNAGEPIAEEQDLFGTSVDLAHRICDRAEPGQILASDVLRQLVMGKDFLFADLGETELRGFKDPVKLWEVRWRESA